MASDAPKRCYYEVLGVERTATEGEIKVAYRKLALQWHPDKNLGNPEATAIFQQIQEANSVLSDSRERSWYDSHRDEILRGGDGQGGDGGGDGEGYVVNVWPYFSGAAFSGYSDESGGFYAVYRGVFEEVEARERDGAVGGDRGLSFGWADEYREQDAPSRQIRRAMEKENRKARDAAKRKYQEAVRALVDYVKKRDKRVIQHQIEVQREEAERARAKAEAAKVQAEAFRTQREEWLKEQTRQWEEDEAARREEEEAGGRVAFRLADEESSGDSDEDEDGGGGGGRRRRGKKGKGKGGGKGSGVVFECAVCNKTFKSEKQMHNHQQSRAHRKMVEELQAEFGEELDDVLGVLEEGDGEMEDDPDLLGAEAEAEAAVGEEGAEAGTGEGEDMPAATGEDAPPSPPEEAEEGEEEASKEEESSDEEEEDVGQAGRAMNRFAFGDDSTSDED